MKKLTEKDITEYSEGAEGFFNNYKTLKGIASGKIYICTVYQI
jgi:hypothetical protein